MTKSSIRQMPPVDDQLAVLMSGVDYGDEHLKSQMERELRSLLQQDRPLRVYLGVDPTATSLTLGHTVPLRKLRQFQQLGHHAIFLIGDYTALIGDPSDKNKLRPQLSQEDIKANERTYFDQAAKILDPAKTELRHNSEWLGKLRFPDIISLMSKFTVQEMLRRDNFRQRFGRTSVDVMVSDKRVVWTTPAIGNVREEGVGRYRASAIDLSIVGFGVDEWKSEPKLSVSEPIYLHEFLYALMQGYDAYALECDVQVGGTEQLFNLMAGRKIQEDAGQKPHVPVTMPILVGLDGKARMSKSAGNHIGVNDTADEQYGKAMSLPDEVIIDFFVLATNVPRTELTAIQHEIERDPMAAKKRLARTIVSEFHGEDAAAEAEARFERTVQRKETPDEIPEFAITGFPTLIDVLVAAGAAPSKREARRLFEQRAVTVEGTPVDAHVEALRGMVVQVGKRRWLRLV
ncbi:MAG: tyrosine--tRNA ligase [Anaerolinea sp.]|nr:tyrosine--tRNA ligase [Anaerolinea sp.]